jgi:hypothetical protein
MAPLLPTSWMLANELKIETLKHPVNQDVVRAKIQALVNSMRQPNRSASSVVTNAALTLPIPEPDIRVDADWRGTDALTDANRRELRVLDVPPPQTFTQSLLLNIPCRITPATQSDDHAAC